MMQYIKVLLVETNLMVKTKIAQIAVHVETVSIVENLTHGEVVQHTGRNAKMWQRQPL